MRKLLVSVALATAALAAVPAAAQYHGNGWNDHRGFDRRGVGELMSQLNGVENRIDRSARNRIISPREAQSLRQTARSIRHHLHRVARNGLSRQEFANVDFQIDRLQRRLRAERRDFDWRRG